MPRKLTRSPTRRIPLAWVGREVGTQAVEGVIVLGDRIALATGLSKARVAQLSRTVQLCWRRRLTARKRSLAIRTSS